MTPFDPVPAATQAARSRPDAPGLDAMLRHAGGWKAISITASPQVVDLVLTNRTALPLALDEAIVDVTFRPGVLAASEAIVLAPQSEPDWHLTLAALDGGEVRLRLHSARADVLQPGDGRLVRLAGVSAAPEGGSRGTRVEVSYAGVLTETGAELAGHALIHLPVLRRHPPAAPPRPRERASTAMAGPFFAGIVRGAAVLNDGKSGNEVVVRVMNISGQPVPLGHDGDAATRFHLTWRRGLREADFGLLGAEGGHLGLRPSEDRDWTADRHTLRRTAPGALPPGGWVDLVLDLHTDALDGQAELMVTFENLPGHDDGELSLPVTLGPMAVVESRDDEGEVRHAIHFLRPLELRGEAAALSFHVAEEGTDVLEPEDVPTLSVGRTFDRLGALVVRAARGVRIESDMDVSGDITAPTGQIRNLTAGSVTSDAVSATGQLSSPAISGGSLTLTGDVVASSMTARSRLSGNSLQARERLDIGSWRFSPTGPDMGLWGHNVLRLAFSEDLTRINGRVEMNDVSARRVRTFGVGFGEGWFIKANSDDSQLEFWLGNRIVFRLGSGGPIG